MTAIVRLSISIALAVGLGLIIGCGEEDSTTAPARDTTAAKMRVDSANGLLEGVLMDLVNGEDPEKPADVDLTNPYNAYLHALSADDSNPAANFGAGVLEIIMISQDNEFGDFFDSSKTFFDRGDYFEVQGLAGAPRPGPGLALRLDKSVLPLAAAVNLGTNLSRAAAAGDPTITKFQDLLARKLIPRLEKAVARLKKVTTRPEFKFIITPRMQGDAREDPLELDLTEVYAAIVAIDVQLALLDQFCAYNYDMGWTGASMLAALTPGSPFLALRSGGSGRMAAAGLAWLNAVNSLESGIQFLESETDEQSNDLIKLDPNDDSDDEALDSLKSYIPRVRRAITGQETFTFELDDGDEDITIALSAMFSRPIADLKTLIPLYSVSLDTVASDIEYRTAGAAVTARVQIPSPDYYYWYRHANYEDGQRTYYGESRPFYAAQWDSAWDAWEARFRIKPYAYLGIEFWDYLGDGAQDVQTDIYCSYDEPTKWRYAPRITWQANSFSEWIFPDPTFGGLIPGMTDSRLKRILGITGEGWDKVVTWD